ncbi:hypothetical protein BUALT_Bualt01G0078400 [Buddleja alternifolia]|uniref:J domain-containing protein n=1 Tax=Buddleja alternifolia TaxID=168488 RepID=A0AAV6YG69_9LAMI|nr:hypothetical protein BUALT_Bualt01G0078400 [Buddleja alternifolia]
MLTTIDVYVSAENKISGEVDWYSVLGLNQSVDDEAIKKQNANYQQGPPSGKMDPLAGAKTVHTVHEARDKLKRAFTESSPKEESVKKTKIDDYISGFGVNYTVGLGNGGFGNANSSASGSGSRPYDFPGFSGFSSTYRKANTTRKLTPFETRKMLMGNACKEILKNLSVWGPKTSDARGNIDGINENGSPEMFTFLLRTKLVGSQLVRCAWSKLSVDDEAIEKQYRKLALMLHPDKNKPVGADGAFMLISEVFGMLSDKARRLAYNQRRGFRVFPQKVLMPTGGPGPSAPAPPTGNGIFNFSSRTTSQTPNYAPPPYRFLLLANSILSKNQYFLGYMSSLQGAVLLRCISTILSFATIVRSRLWLQLRPCPKIFPNLPIRSLSSVSRVRAIINRVKLKEEICQLLKIWELVNRVPVPLRMQIISRAHFLGPLPGRTDPSVGAKTVHIVHEAHDKLKRAFTESRPREQNVKKRKLDDYSSRFGVNYNVGPANAVHRARVHGPRKQHPKPRVSHSADSASEEHPKPEVKTTIVPGPDFHDFDQDRTKSSFRDNEIWSAYDDDHTRPQCGLGRLGILQHVWGISGGKIRVVHKYDTTMVLDDYGEENGVSVAPLVKVIVPHHVITSQEAQSVPEGCLELDPAATPLELLQNVPETKEAQGDNGSNENGSPEETECLQDDKKDLFSGRAQGEAYDSAMGNMGIHNCTLWMRGKELKMLEVLSCGQEQEVDQDLELLVLASDGLWDVVANEDAVSIARKLTGTAFTRGSCDNITCIVVKFHYEKVGPEETQTTTGT